MTTESIPIKLDGSPQRVTIGECPTCGTVGKVVASKVFNVEVCYPCLLNLARGSGWV